MREGGLDFDDDDDDDEFVFVFQGGGAFHVIFYCLIVQASQQHTQYTVLIQMELKYDTH